MKMVQLVVYIKKGDNKMSKESNDKVIKQLMDKVEEQKASLGTRKKHVLNTNGIFKYDENATYYININTVCDSIVFVNALGFLLSNRNQYEQAADRLNIKVTAWKWLGFTLQEWEEDFKARIEQIEYDKKKKQLDATKAKLDTLVSEEARTEMELENIQKSLGI
jgi:hypothetical protein